MADVNELDVIERALAAVRHEDGPLRDVAQIALGNVRAEVARLRDALKRNRQGYRNLLELRKLDGEKWGQRDGYGGRYGALTRDEIEGVIAEIDVALSKES